MSEVEYVYQENPEMAILHASSLRELVEQVNNANASSRTPVFTKDSVVALHKEGTDYCLLYFKNYA